MLLGSLMMVSMTTRLGATTLTQSVAGVQPSTISGVVVNTNGPVVGATVRIQATQQSVRTAADGTFALTTLNAAAPVTVTAWITGHYIGWAVATPGSEDVQITLNAHYVTDNPEYDWFAEGDVEGSAACGLCHTAYAEWQADAHSQSAVNPLFLTIYQGTDVDGNESPRVVKNNLGIPLPPDLSQPYYGPGYKLDNPNRTGNCAACHTPMASKIPNNQNCGWSGCHTSSTAQLSEFVPDGVSPVGLEGDAAEGISCEFCHKVGQVFLEDETGLPYGDLPGILSVRLFRPKSAGDDLFFGPLDDIARADVPAPRDVYLPLMKESSFCAGCHYGIMGGVVENMKVTGGVVIYSSYAEWLDSPYSDPENGKSCQECHMPPVAGASHFVFPERGGVARPAEQIHTHQMRRATDEEFMRGAVTLSATAQVVGRGLEVKVQVTNDQTGHAVPTDSTLRHVMLVVEARDARGRLLALQRGDRLPAWAGDYAGQPGRAFAKILRDEWTGEVPTAAIWRPIQVVQDTRLLPFVTNTSTYTFASDGKPATVTVRLVYRRAFQQLLEWKGLTIPDMLMAEERLIVKK
jgi:hypothetical protein